MINWDIVSSRINATTSLICFWEKMLLLSQEQVQWVEEKEDFVRLCYDIDNNKSIDTDILRYIALTMYQKNIVKNISTLQTNIKNIKTKYLISNDSPVENIILFMKELSEKKEENIFIELDKDKVVNIELRSPNEVISFELKQPDVEIDTLETCEFELEEKSSANTLRNIWPNTQSTKKWISDFSKTRYKSLQERDFFRPEIIAASKWTWKKYQRGKVWLLDEQEFYIRIPRSQVGYQRILTHKYLKIQMVITKDKLKSLSICKPSDFLRILKGILSSPKLSNKEKKILNQLKDSILIRKKMLLETETILDIINYGNKKFEKILRLVSYTTNKRKINRQIYQYLLSQVELNIKNHQIEFRKKLEKTSSLEHLQVFLKKYSLKRLSLIERYPDIKIIQQVKLITRDYNNQPQEIHNILNKYLGTTGETNIRNKLPEILHTNLINIDILNKVANDRYLEDLQHTLKELQKKSKYKKIANSVLHLMQTFLNSKKFTYTEFKTSLNFVPRKFQNKILVLVQRKLQEQIKMHLNNILVQEGRYVKRYNEVLIELKNLQYQNTNIKIYNTSPINLHDKIQSIKYKQESIDKIIQHTFRGLDVEKSLILLIKNAKSAKELGKEKTFSNCLRILNKITTMQQQKETVNIKKVLISLFKQHGKINFANENQEINGYVIAQIISRFYNDATIKKLEFPQEIKSEISNKIKVLMEVHEKK